GTQAKNSQFIDAQLAKIRDEAEDAAKRGDPLRELGALRSLVSDFDGLKDAAIYRQRLETLKRSPALKQALKKEDSAIAEQQTLSSDLFSELGELETSPSENWLTLRSR